MTIFIIRVLTMTVQCTASYSHTRLTALIPGLPGWASTRKVKPIWISLKQEAVSGSGISWAICKSAPRSRHITTPAPHHSVFYRPDALPAAQPIASKHWRQPQPAIQQLRNWLYHLCHLLKPHICHSFQASLHKLLNPTKSQVNPHCPENDESWEFWWIVED